MKRGLFSQTPSKTPSQTPSEPRAAVALVAALFFGLLLLQDGTDATEAWQSLPLSRAMAEGHLSIEKKPVGQYVRAPDGRFWLAQDYLAPLLAMPVVALADALPNAGLSRPRHSVGPRDVQASAAAASLGALWAALTGGTIFLFATRRLGVRPRAALGAALLTVLGTTVLPYSRTGYDGALSGLLLLAALFAATSERDRVRAFGTGLLCGLATLARFSSAIAALPIALLAISHAAEGRARARAASQLALAALPLALVWAGLNLLRTGHPFVPASALPQFADNNALDGPFWLGFFGNLLSPNKGLLFFAPLALLGLVGLGKSRHRRVFVSVLAALIGLLVFHAKVRNWSGHWGWGPRYLVPVIPLCALGIACLFESQSQRWRRALVAVAIPSIALNLLAVAANWTLRLSVSPSVRSARFPFDPRLNQPLDHLGALLSLRDGCPELSYLGKGCVLDVWWLTWPTARADVGIWVMPLAVGLALVSALSMIIAWRATRQTRSEELTATLPQTAPPGA
ncbi:MAG: hypothetical protein LBM75_06675 [Myxococcales bacterium]|jgi:hypothetical protein|nr:hypothetical protein [Myxococcales bacterium]